MNPAEPETNNLQFLAYSTTFLLTQFIAKNESQLLINATTEHSFLSRVTKMTPMIAASRDRDAPSSTRRMAGVKQGSDAQGPPGGRRFELSSGAVPG